MNGIKNLGATVTGAVQAGIAALPLYALQRAVGQQRAVDLVRRFRGANSPFPWVAGYR